MYPRSRGKPGPPGSTSADADASLNTESVSLGVSGSQPSSQLTSATVRNAVSDTLSPSVFSSPQQPLQQQQQPPQLHVPQSPHSPHAPYTGGGFAPAYHNPTMNRGGGADPNFYPPTHGGGGGAGLYHEGGSPKVPPSAYYGGRGGTAFAEGTLPMQRGTATPAYEHAIGSPPPLMPPPPPPPPPPPDAALMSSAYLHVSTPCGSPATGGSGAVPTNYPSFSHHSRTSSGTPVGMMSSGDRSGATTAAYRPPPPMYGDSSNNNPPNMTRATPPTLAHFPATNSANAMNTNSSYAGAAAVPFNRAGPAGAGAPPSGSSSGFPHSIAAAPPRLPPYMNATAGAATSTSPSPSAHNSNNAINSLSSTMSGSGGSPSAPPAQAPVKRLGSDVSLTPPTPAARLPRGPTGLRITVGTSNPGVTPVSPLMNAPTQATAPAPAGGHSEPNRGTRRPSQPDSKPTHEGSSDAQQVPAPTKTATPTPAAPSVAERESDAPNSKDSTSAGSTTSKPTVEQAEARYQYLYEEFRKVSRVRTKMAEENERLKRELGTTREELAYYRQKTLTAAEERDVLTHDYQQDVSLLLRLVDALAADVVAAHHAHPKSSNHEENGPASHRPASSQQAVDAAVARLPAVTEAGLMSAPFGLADHLGLRCGMWVANDEHGSVSSSVRLDNEEYSHVAAAAGTSPHQQPQQTKVLLRDEMRDLHRNTHIAMNSYMTSLDYGVASAVAMGQPNYGSRGGRRGGNGDGDRNSSGNSNTASPSQPRFSSEYRGLRLCVDVPRLHSQSLGSSMNNMGNSNNNSSNISTEFAMRPPSESVTVGNASGLKKQSSFGPQQRARANFGGTSR